MMPTWRTSAPPTLAYFASLIAGLRRGRAQACMRVKCEMGVSMPLMTILYYLVDLVFEYFEFRCPELCNMYDVP